MILYLIIILMSSMIIIICNIIGASGVLDYSALAIASIVAYAVIVEIIIDAIIAGLIHSLPNKLFAENMSIFQVSKKERNFYEKLNIKKWKDKVAELGVLGGFRKNKIKEPNNKDYLHKFIIECNIGIVIHILSIFIGFAIIFLLPIEFRWSIGFPVAIVNSFLHILVTMVLRYNVPKLQAGYKRILRQQI